MKTMRQLAMLAGLAVALGQAHAQDSNWSLSLGVHQVKPRSNNGSLAGGALAVDIDNAVRPTLVLNYHFSPRWSLDVLAAVPFKHTVALNGVDAVDITHLPPTVSLLYHFAPEARVRPFLGLGVNYTFIYDEKARGPLAGTRVRLDDSFGLAARAGLQFVIDPNWSVTADVRWMDIDTDVSVDGVDVGSARVDPTALGLMVQYRF